MDIYHYEEILKNMHNKIGNIKQILKPDETKERLAKIELLEQEPSFWSDQNKATKISKEKNGLLGKLSKYNKTKNSIDETKELFDMAKSENDTDTLDMLFEEIGELQQTVQNTEVEVMLSGENDTLDAIVSIHPGAGGTESCDWANMLYRMYLRWAEKKGFKIELLDYQTGDEVGHSKWHKCIWATSSRKWYP